MKEIYKDIIGYQGLYQISSKGNVRSFHRYGYGKLLKPVKDTNGYLFVRLSDLILVKSCRINRLVADAFLNNDKNLPHVNHINGYKEDNTVKNLEWCSISHNIKHAYDIGLRSPKKKTVYQYTLNSELIREWDCTNSIHKTLGICKISIVSCCLGKQKTAGGFLFSYLPYISIK